MPTPAEPQPQAVGAEPFDTPGKVGLAVVLIFLGIKVAERVAEKRAQAGRA